MALWLMAVVTVVFSSFAYGSLPDTGWTAPNISGGILLALGTFVVGGALLQIGTGAIGAVTPRRDKLAITGPYRFMRHPIYAGLTLLLLGMAVRLQSPIGIAAVLILFVPASILRGRREDAALQERFGREWRDYADQVGFWFPRARKRDGGKARLQ